MAAIIFEDQFLVPHSIDSFEAFREWVQDDSFPGQGRIDFVAERIEIDMSPEELFSHGRLKAEFARVIGNLCESRQFLVFIDSTRVSQAKAELSTEPDVVVVSRQRIRSGNVKLLESAPGRYAEIQGGPDIVVEIVSESSVEKDTVRLPKAHFVAGTLEYWLVDARDVNRLVFQIQHRGELGFACEEKSLVWQYSRILNSDFRVLAEKDEDGWPDFRVQSRVAQ